MVGGSIKSEPGFEPVINGELHGVGYDYIRSDATGGHMRLDVRSQLKCEATLSFTPLLIWSLAGWTMDLYGAQPSISGKN